MQNQINRHILFDHREILKNIKGNDIQEKLSRLSVYRNNVFHSLTEAMTEIFPITREMVGEECFNALVYGYICNAPPSSPILSEYGHQFSAHIAKQPELAEYAYLPDLAQLEYQLLQVTHQKEEHVLTPTEIALYLDSHSDIEHSRWKLSSSTQLLSCQFRIGSLYKKISGKKGADSTFHWHQREWIILCKNHLNATFYIVDNDEWVMIKKLKENSTFSQATEHLNQKQLIPIFQSVIQKPFTTKIVSGE